MKDRLLFLSLLAVVVGLLGGLVAEGLLLTINLLNNILFFHRVSDSFPTAMVLSHWWMILLPAAGGFLVGLIVQYFSPEIKGDGIPEAMAVVLTNRSIVKPRVGFFKPLSAAITVGTGGPFGAEGPIIQTGGALGSILSQFIPSSPSERRTLLACGAAAGLAGVFKTPFAGVMMAVELLVFEFRARSFIPIAIASATGTMVAMVFRGAGAVFPLQTGFQFHLLELPFFVVLGVLCAGLAWVMTRTLYICEDFFEHMTEHWHVWFPLIPALGGLVVGGIAWFYPQVLGTGYAVIADVLAKPHPMHVLVGIGLAKLLAFGVALGAGCSGGTFAPALMIGGSLGAAYGSLVHMILPTSSSIGLYGMVATAALFGSVYRATPSAILFMLEVTGAYHAMLPCFLVAVISDLAVHHFMRTTINTERLVRRGTLVPEAYSVDPMRLMRVRDIMSPELESVRKDRKVGEFLADVIHHSVVPVVDAQDRYVGVLHRARLVEASEVTTADELTERAYPTVYEDDVVHDVVVRLLKDGYKAFPVLDRKTGDLVGMVTAFDVLKSKNWEIGQDMPEPGRLWGLAMARFNTRSSRSAE